MADEVQPEVEGQGDAGSTGLFDSYLQSVPEDSRPVVEQYLADAAKNVNSRLEEAATLRSTYEPLSQVAGLADYDPDNLAQLIGWHQSVTTSEDAYREWIAAQAKEAGLIEAVAEQVEETGELTKEQVQSWMQEQMSPVSSRLEELQQQQFVNSESQLIADRFADIEREYGSLSKEQKDMIVDLGIGATPEDATLVSGTDWIGTGFERFQAIYAEGQKVLVDGKLQQPEPALAGGGTAAHELPKTFEEAGLRARETLRRARGG